MVFLFPRFTRMLSLKAGPTDHRRTLSMFEIIATTLTAQLYSLGLCQKGPLVAMGLVCGNALINASMQQSGFDSVVSGVYGISCVTYSTMMLVTSVLFLKIDQLSHSDVGYFLLAWSWINILFALRCLRFGRVLQFLFFFFVSLGSLLEVLTSFFAFHRYPKLPNYTIIFALCFPLWEVSASIVHHKETSEGGEEDPDALDILTQVSDVAGMNPLPL